MLKKSPVGITVSFEQAEVESFLDSYVGVYPVPAELVILSCQDGRDDRERDPARDVQQNARQPAELSGHSALAPKFQTQ